MDKRWDEASPFLLANGHADADEVYDDSCFLDSEFENAKKGKVGERKLEMSFLIKLN